MLTIHHQQTWLCSSLPGVESRILPLVAGRRFLLSWSPSDSPADFLIGNACEITGEDWSSTYNSKCNLSFLQIILITCKWPVFNIVVVSIFSPFAFHPTKNGTFHS